jgi:hypothetical protein
VGLETHQGYYHPEFRLPSLFQQGWVAGGVWSMVGLKRRRALLAYYISCPKPRSGGFLVNKFFLKRDLLHKTLFVNQVNMYRTKSFAVRWDVPAEMRSFLLLIGDKDEVHHDEDPPGILPGKKYKEACKIFTEDT